MNPPSELFFSPLDLAVTVSSILVAVAFALALYRVWRGPSAIDRVLALDLCNGVVMALIVLLAIKYNTAAYLDVAVILAIVGFVATAVFARRIGQGGEK